MVIIEGSELTRSNLFLYCVGVESFLKAIEDQARKKDSDAMDED